jgi:hypothetical protein
MRAAPIVREFAYSSLKRLSSSTRLHGAISQKGVMKHRCFQIHNL